MISSFPPTAPIHLSIVQALEKLRAGELLLITDDDQVDSAGHLLVAAQFATPAVIERMRSIAGGAIRLALTRERIEVLGLPIVMDQRLDKNPTAFTTSITAGFRETERGTPVDQARTIQRAIHPETQPQDLQRPGWVYPVQALRGGVLKRAGHTEAAVDLTQQAGLYPAGVLCEISSPPESWNAFKQVHDLKQVTLAELIAYQVVQHPFIRRESIAALPSDYGKFQIYSYRDTLEHKEHLAILKGDPHQFPQQPVLVRIHSECLTGDSLGSLRCDCRRQLEVALKLIEQQGQGVVVYLRQEGRGIGLINKLKAYSLQDQGLDTVEANQQLGFAPDLRNYGVGAQILRDLGVRSMRLITNNPRKISGLKGFGLEVAERVPLLVEENAFNQRYLATKARKLGHLLLRTRLLAIGLYPQEFTGIADPHQRSPRQRAVWVDQLRQIAAAQGLLVQEDTRPIAAVVFGAEAVIAHVGLEEERAILPWYTDPLSSLGEPERLLRRALLRILWQLCRLPGLNQIGWVVAAQQEPLSGWPHVEQPIPHTPAQLQQWHQQIDVDRLPELDWQERKLYLCSLTHVDP